MKTFIAATLLALTSSSQLFQEISAEYLLGYDLGSASAFEEEDAVDNDVDDDVEVDQTDFEPACPKSQFSRPIMHSFNANDSVMSCMNTIMEAEEGYAFKFRSYIETEEEICNLMQDILRTLKVNNIQLVDNIEFLEVAQTIPNQASNGLPL